MPQLGLLFDLDGTLTNSDPWHFEAFGRLLQEFGRNLTHDDFTAHISGGENAAVMRFLFPEVEEHRHAALIDRKEAMFRELSRTMAPIDGLLDLLKLAEARGAKVGVVTNAPRLNAEHMLTSLGLERFIDGIVVGDEIARGKPDPLPYLTGLERIGCSPERTIAFEDSAFGVRSASGAGIVTVGITTSRDRASLLAAGAAMTISDYRDPTMLALVETALGGGVIAARSHSTS